MHLQPYTTSLFQQLEEVLSQLNTEEFTAPSQQLFGASIAQHTRHIIELFIELQNGYETGLVNYDNRARSYQIESSPMIAKNYLQQVLEALPKPNKNLTLTTVYNDDSIQCETNYYREWVYNIEHTVHHMALIRVGVNELSNVVVPTYFGVASSTLQYQKTCAQ